MSAAVSHSVNGKAWVNQILEANPVPTLWVTNRIEQIDPAFRRRFAYHLELTSPPPGAREQLLRKTLEGVPVGDAFVARLSERKGLTPAQIRTAVRFAGLVKETLCRQFLLELEKLLLQGTGTKLLDSINDQLVFATWFINRNPPPTDDLAAIAKRLAEVP